MASDAITVECPGTCTVTLQVEPAAASPDQYQAALGVFAALLGAAAVIWGFRRMVRLFDSAPE
jgi:flagellar biogenesis protein FliO